MKAAQAAYTAFNERSLTPDEQWDWGDYDNRMVRYSLYDGLYNNVAYRRIETYSATMKYQYDLYKHIRGIYNPAYRLVELIVAKTMGGAIDWRALQTGAIQVSEADDTLIEAILQVMRWSKWGQNKNLFARQCAKLGDVGLWIVDDREREKVRLEVLHPGKIVDAMFDTSGNVKAAVIEYQREWVDEQSGKRSDVVYRMEVDKEVFRTYKDKEPFAWNGVDAEWDNEYGFVPLVVGNYKDVGLQWGANCYHASLSKIHEINDAASLLNDSIRKVIDPWWYLAGTTASTELKGQGNLSDGTVTRDPSAQRDKVKTLHGPEGSQPYPMVMPIDIANAGGNVQNLLAELERDMPELTMQRIRDGGAGLSGVAIKNMYGDAIGRIDEAAGNLDDAMIRAFQMAISIGGMRGYDGFSAYNLDSYERGDLTFYIRERELFADKLSPQERVQVMTALPDNPELTQYILEKELEIAPDDVKRIVDAMRQQPQSAPQQAHGNMHDAAMTNTEGDDIPDDAMNDIEGIIRELGLDT